MSNTTVASLKPYPLYKESGIPWLGQLPKHWKVVPNKSVMQLRKKTVGEHFADYTLLSLTKQGVIPRNLDEPTGKFPESFDTYQVAEPGDLILGIEGGFYPNPRSAAKNAPKGMKEFYPTPPIETKSRTSGPRETGHRGPQNGPDRIKMLAQSMRPRQHNKTPVLSGNEARWKSY